VAGPTGKRHVDEEGAVGEVAKEDGQRSAREIVAVIKASAFAGRRRNEPSRWTPMV